MKHSIDTIINVMNNMNYSVFESDKPYNLNIVGVRSEDSKSNKFNDLLYVFYRDKGEWVAHEFNVTVDPGLVYRVTPLNPSGTAIIMPGQYKGMWKLGLHRGKYEALVQAKPCTVARDNNRDYILNSDIPVNSVKREKRVGDVFVNEYLLDGEVVFTTETGMFGINCHKAGQGITIDVNTYSAGCVVFADSNTFEDVFLPLCKAAANAFANSFSFTLVKSNNL